MKFAFTRTWLVALAAAAFCNSIQPAHAGEIGHFNGGIPNLRDYLVPEPGIYGVLYNYFYRSDRINDESGHKIDSVTIQPGRGPSLTVDVDVDLELYVVAPALMWVSPWKIAGAKYAAYVLPSFATSSLNATASTANGRGGSVDNSAFGLGDLFVQPIWLGWTLTHGDFSLGYGVYAPIGKYDTETVTFPVVGPVKMESEDNIGLGFWTHQIQGAAAWYPWTNKATAVVASLTYEINGKKEGFDITPGQILTLNWGISQYLPLTRDQEFLLEAGVAGYDSWQITDDSGNDAKNSDVHDQVHAVGGQLGLTYVPWRLSISGHGFHEYAAKDRFQGSSFGINLAKQL